MRYMLVPEHHKSGAWHFHGLLSHINNNDMKIALNNKEFNKNGEPNIYYNTPLRISYPNGSYIYNMYSYKLGFTTATKINDTKKAISYITKYITKDLCELTKNKKRYYASTNIPKTQEMCYTINPDNYQEFLKQFQIENNLTITYNELKDIKEDGYTNKIVYTELDKLN